MSGFRGCRVAEDAGRARHGHPPRVQRGRARTSTPIVTLMVRAPGSTHRLSLKLEAYNPTGSIKFRTAVGLLAALDAREPLVPGTQVIESTSGNLGVALAALLSEIDCRFTAVVDPKASPLILERITYHGGNLVHVDVRDSHGGFLLSRLAEVRRRLAEDPLLRWTDQYSNLANPEIHRDTIARELVEQTSGRMDAVLVAVSTGGTLAGISQGLRAELSAAPVYGVDVLGSLATSEPAAPHLLSGIGATRRSTFLQDDHFKDALRVHDVMAFAVCRKVRRETGLMIGGSGGAVVAAYLAALPSGGLLAAATSPVAVIADGGDAYLSTVYDERWLETHGVLNDVEMADRTIKRAGIHFELIEVGGG